MGEVNRALIEVEKDGEKVLAEVVRPDHRTVREAELAESRAFCEAVRPGGGGPPLLTALMMGDELKRQGLWGDAQQSKREALEKEIGDAERRLAAGKNGYPSRAAARAAAVRVRKARRELRALLSVRNTYDRHTADGLASQAKFDHLVAACTVYQGSGDRYFKDVEDYKTREAAGDPVVPEAQKAIGKLHYGIEDGWEKDLPENKFLLRHGYCDEALWLLDDRKRRTDDSGRLVDENGRFVDEEGRFVDASGARVDAKGDPEVEFAEFDD